MSVLLFMIPVSLLLGFGFVGAFIWSVSDGQFDDTETPAHRILEDAAEDNSQKGQDKV